MKYSLYRKDIFEGLKQYEQFADYSDEWLKADLEVLVDQGNIFHWADATYANTPEEFINKVFFYQLSPATVEIERMLIRLESVRSGAVQKSSLESSYIENFRTILAEIDNLYNQDEKAHHTWWMNVNDNFMKFSENYKDYISDFYSPKASELLKTSEFLIFKEQFIVYLRNFITGIQMNASQIVRLFDKIDTRLVKSIIEKAADYEAKIPNMTFVFQKEEFVELNRGKYQTMVEWFLTVGGQRPLYEQLIDHTNEIIRKITRFALQILDKRNMGVNRKKDYEKLIEIFRNVDNTAEAHKLSALVFGVEGTRHLLADETRTTDSTNSSVFDEKPTRVSLKPSVNTYKEKLKKTNIPDYAEDKEKRRQEILAKQRFDEMQVRKLIKDSKIELKSLPEISAAQRGTILSWFSKKVKETDNVYVGETDFGAKFRIIKQSDGEEIHIRCEDGDFYMPHFVIEVEEDGVGASEVSS
jgi:uncharacterized protein (TIGR02677 family)